MRSVSNGFRGGLFKNNKLKNKNKKLLCAFVCLSLGLKKLGDFTMSEGHGYPLMKIIVKLAVSHDGMYTICALQLMPFIVLYVSHSSYLPKLMCNFGFV